MPDQTLHITQSSVLPPAQPTYILRGHTAQIHAVHFLHDNLRLLSGDADGWLVVWDIPTKRPVTVWRAHSTTILGIKSWGHDRIITHGRDNKLQVWQLKREDEPTYSKILPIDDATTDRKQPWLLHSLPVNALNFCAFAMCPDTITPPRDGNPKDSPPGILIAVPGIQDGHIHITSLPSETRIATIPSPPGLNTGMVMSLGLHILSNTTNSSINNLVVLAAYESGHVCVWQTLPSSSTTTVFPLMKWTPTSTTKPHTQPVLSLAISPSTSFFYTSSADAILAQHTLPSQASSFSSTAAAQTPQTLQTRHAGQQSLCVRSDGKYFATAGWDGRVRVYSTANDAMKEVAVLKWHKEGCYAVDFAGVELASTTNTPMGEGEVSGGQKNMVQRRNMTVSETRIHKAQTTHWLAAGSKDGRVSLWDIF